jgi:hypothetical protein
LTSPSYTSQSTQLVQNLQDTSPSHRPWLAQQNSHLSAPRCPPVTSTHFSSALLFWDGLMHYYYCFLENGVWDSAFVNLFPGIQFVEYWRWPISIY